MKFLKTLLHFLISLTLIFLFTNCGEIMSSEDEMDDTLLSSSNNPPPTVKIKKPVDNSKFTTADTIEFLCTATDHEDAELTGSSIIWTSDIDGELGAGKSVTSKLTAGTHIIL